MPVYSVATARCNLPNRIDEALAGEEVFVTPHGKPTVAQDMVADPRKLDQTPLQWMAWLKARRDARAPLGLGAVDLIRQMRDDRKR